MGAEELNDRVRDGNGCGLLAIATAPKGLALTRIGVFLFRLKSFVLEMTDCPGKEDGQAARPISTG